MAEEKKLTLRGKFADYGAKIDAAIDAGDFDLVKQLRAEMKVLESNPSSAIERVDAISKLLQTRADPISAENRVIALQVVKDLQVELTSAREEVVKLGYSPKSVYADPVTLTIKIAQGSPQKGTKREKPNAAGFAIRDDAPKDSPVYKALVTLRGTVFTQKKMGELLYAAGQTKILRCHFNENEKTIFAVVQRVEKKK